jgi:hypothetical protein
LNTIKLTKKLKASTLPETLTIRLHRAISWLKSAEKQDGNLDLKFISLWIAFNASYAVDLNGISSKPEKAKLRDLPLVWFSLIVPDYTTYFGRNIVVL